MADSAPMGANFSWHTYEDDLLHQFWGQLDASELAEVISNASGRRRTTRALEERARRLRLGLPGGALKTLTQLERETGYAKSRLRTAVQRLKLPLQPIPKAMRTPGRWYGLAPDQVTQLLEFLATVPDGQRLRLNVAGAWGGRGRRKPYRCRDCGRRDRPHLCRGRCGPCDQRWRVENRP